MKKKIAVAIGILAICVVIVVLFINGNIEGINKNAIGETDITKKTYGFPIISLLNYNGGKLTVEAGYYRYGDVNLDAVVDENDISDIDLIINSELYYSNGQKLLADVDESGKVDNDDIITFKKYLEVNGPVKYDLHRETLEYCVTKTNNSKTCSWTKDSVFTLTEKRDYYVFVRQKDTLVESEVSIFEKESMEEKEKLKN